MSVAIGGPRAISGPGPDRVEDRPYRPAERYCVLSFEAQEEPTTYNVEEHEARWIREAAATLGLEEDQFCRLSPDDSLLTWWEAEARFSSQPNLIWWWETFRCRHYHVRLRADHYTLLPALAPTDGQHVWLMLTDIPGDAHRPGNALVYDSTVEACSAVIGEAPAFEYNLVAHDFTWMLCENHHDDLFVVGFRAMRRLQQYAKHHPEMVALLRTRGVKGH